MRVKRRLHLLVLVLLALLVFILTIDAKAQPIAYARIVTDRIVYLSSPKRTDTVKMEFVYFTDSVLVVMRPQEGKTLVQWLYLDKGFGVNNGLMPTDFYTKKDSPVKIIEDVDKPGWLIVSSVKFRSINRMVYKVYPYELPNGDIVPRVKIYVHEVD